MTQLDVAGRTVSPLTGQQLAALLDQLPHDGVYPGDLADAGHPIDGAVSRSFLLRMRDGVRIAVDVHVPPSSTPVPACLRSTRYWRSTTGSATKEHLEVLEVQRWLREGFALVIVDARGTGASFGTWTRAWDDAQRDDLIEVVDWIVTQPWSDGSVGGYGTSYDGSTAHLLAATGHPAVKAVVPRFALFDSYADVAAPGGVPLDYFLENWAAVNWALDGHPDRGTVALPVPVVGSVRPVDEDADGSLLAAARASHVNNWDLWADVSGMSCREDVSAHADLGNGTPYARIWELHKARVPTWLWSSWYDGAYAAAQLRQLADPELDVRVTIGPFSHGASLTALGDPLHPDRRNVTMQEQVHCISAYLRRELTGLGEDPSPASLRYYRLGDDWLACDQWPPADSVLVRHHLGGDGVLGHEGDSRTWQVEHEATTGSAGTRWHALIGGGHVSYADRREQDAHLLSWQGPPLAEALGITGTPVLHLDLISSSDDVALHAYLEAVLPDGKVLYLTEGLLRASHRHLASATTTTSTRTADRGHIEPLTVGRQESLEWELLPISALLPAGAHLRVSLAGADAGLFRRIPATGDVTLEVLGSSWIELPQQDGGLS